MGKTLVWNDPKLSKWLPKSGLLGETENNENGGPKSRKKGCQQTSKIANMSKHGTKITSEWSQMVPKLCQMMPNGVQQIMSAVQSLRSSFNSSLNGAISSATNGSIILWPKLHPTGLICAEAGLTAAPPEAKNLWKTTRGWDLISFDHIYIYIYIYIDICIYISFIYIYIIYIYIYKNI